MSKTNEQDSQQVIADDGPSEEVMEVAAEGDVEQDGQQEEPTNFRLVSVTRQPLRDKKSRMKFYSRYPFV